MNINWNLGKWEIYKNVCKLQICQLENVHCKSILLGIHDELCINFSIKKLNVKFWATQTKILEDSHSEIKSYL